MVAFAEPSRPTRRAPARQCEGSAPCAPSKNPTLRTDRNQQYSITALTNGSGGIVERYAYSAYGQPTIMNGVGTVLGSSAEGNRFCYTGREWDGELGLYHYRARMYDALAGRFLGRDPIGFEGSPWDLYEYVGGSPLSRTDATGESWGPGGNPYAPPTGGGGVGGGFPWKPVGGACWGITICAQVFKKDLELTGCEWYDVPCKVRARRRAGVKFFSFYAHMLRICGIL